MEAESERFYQELGKRIRKYRKERRFTVEALSKTAGISTKYMYQIEKGRVGFSTEILYKIATALKVPSDALLKENDMDIGSVILSEVTGQFTAEEKDFIKRAIMKEIANDVPVRREETIASYLRRSVSRNS